MAYGAGALDLLRHLVFSSPVDAAVLELGAQTVDPGTPRDKLLACMTTIHGNEAAAERALAKFPVDAALDVGALFENSPRRYCCVDLYPGVSTLVADLNTWQVPGSDRGTFDVITNHGTSEHVADQVNCFRVVHDYAKVGAQMVHQVPFSGYFNHGLYNYHPLFFVFLAAANGYKIEGLSLSAPHMPYTLPAAPPMGSEAWAGLTVQSGIVGCHLRKVTDAPFKLFTDFDQSMMGEMDLPSPWSEIVRDRYDLRVRP